MQLAVAEHVQEGALPVNKRYLTKEELDAKVRNEKQVSEQASKVELAALDTERTPLPEAAEAVRPQKAGFREVAPQPGPTDYTTTIEKHQHLKAPLNPNPQPAASAAEAGGVS